jgi:hypothetical protein
MAEKNDINKQAIEAVNVPIDSKSLKEVSRLILPDSITSLYPRETLVVNPTDAGIPEDQKVVVDMTYDFDGGLYAFVRFKGAAVYLKAGAEKRQIAYQIAVIQQDGESPYRGKCSFMTDPVYIQHDDIEFARQAMLETIRGTLIREVAEQIKAALRKARIDYQSGRVASIPWYVQHTDDTSVWGKIVKRIMPKARPSRKNKGGQA